MTFLEMLEIYGMTFACRQFGLQDHAVITIHEHRVSLECGNYTASEPTTYRWQESQTEEEAAATLKEPFENTGVTFETIGA